MGRDSMANRRFNPGTRPASADCRAGFESRPVGARAMERLVSAVRSDWALESRPFGAHVISRITAFCAGRSRSLSPMEFVSLSHSGVNQRVFEIAREQSGSLCAPNSRCGANWPEKSRFAPQDTGKASANSQRMIPEEHSREAELRGHPAVERQQPAIQYR